MKWKENFQLNLEKRFIELKVLTDSHTTKETGIFFFQMRITKFVDRFIVSRGLIFLFIFSRIFTEAGHHVHFTFALHFLRKLIISTFHFAFTSTKVSNKFFLSFYLPFSRLSFNFLGNLSGLAYTRTHITPALITSVLRISPVPTGS